jgi:hypothetical protein
MDVETMLWLQRDLASLTYCGSNTFYAFQQCYQILAGKISSRVKKKRTMGD